MAHSKIESVSSSPLLERVTAEAEADRIRRLVAIHGSPLLILDFFGERSPSVLAGPTCDSIDVIDDAIMLPPLECAVVPLLG